MATNHPRLSNMLLARVIGKYKPRIIGVIEDGNEGPVAPMIKRILERRHNVHLSGDISGSDADIIPPLLGIGSEGRLPGNSRFLKRAIGLILRKDSSYPEVIILRLQARHASDIKRMLDLTSPDLAVFARRKHIAKPEGGKNISSGEALLLRSLRKKNAAVINFEDGAIKETSLKARCQKITFGLGKEAHVRGELFQGGEGNGKGASFKIIYKGTFVPFCLSGAENESIEGEVYAVLAAAAVGLHFGSNLVEISEALRSA